MQDREDDYELYKQGRDQMDRGLLAEACDTFQKSITHGFHFKTFELLGECELKLGRFDQAVLHLAVAVALNGQLQQKLLFAEALIAVNQHSTALEILEMVLKENAAHPKAMQLLQQSMDGQAS